MSEPSPRPQRSYSWRDRKPWKPMPPAHDESARGNAPDDELPQGDQKWRLNNPKKRGSWILDSPDRRE